jgi:hypothetical protein
MPEQDMGQLVTEHAKSARFIEPVLNGDSHLVLATSQSSVAKPAFVDDSGLNDTRIRYPAAF